MFEKQILRFMLPKAGVPCIKGFEENVGGIQRAQNPISNSTLKHIGVRHHFLRELVERKDISVTHLSSEYQHAKFLVCFIFDFMMYFFSSDFMRCFISWHTWILSQLVGVVRKLFLSVFDIHLFKWREESYLV